MPVIVDGLKTEKVQVPKHPKNEEVGKKWIWKSSRVLIDQMDAEVLKENENATFINWGNLLITKIHRYYQFHEFCQYICVPAMKIIAFIVEMEQKLAKSKPKRIFQIPITKRL